MSKTHLFTLASLLILVVAVVVAPGAPAPVSAAPAVAQPDAVGEAMPPASVVAASITPLPTGIVVAITPTLTPRHAPVSTRTYRPPLKKTATPEPAEYELFASLNGGKLKLHAIVSGKECIKLPGGQKQCQDSVKLKVVRIVPR